jgi:hypothetical protein
MHENGLRSLVLPTSFATCTLEFKLYETPSLVASNTTFLLLMSLGDVAAVRLQDERLHLSLVERPSNDHCTAEDDIVVQPAASTVIRGGLGAEIDQSILAVVDARSLSASSSIWM